jgi:hypothetical protein
VRLDPARQRPLQRRPLLPQPAACHLRQPRRLRLPVDQRRQDLPPGLAQDVRRHRGEFDGGPFRCLLPPVGRRRPLADQARPVAGQLAQPPLRPVGDQARLEQPVPERVGQRGPRHGDAVLGVGLAAGDRLDVPGSDPQHREAVVHQVIDRLPRDAGAPQRDVGAAGRRQPIRQRQEVVGHRGDGPDCLGRPPVRTRRDEARHDPPLVHVRPAAPRIDHVQGGLLRSCRPRGVSTACSVWSACFPGGSDRRWRLRTPGVHLVSGRASTRRSRPHRADRLAPTIPPMPAMFIRRRCPREASATVEKLPGTASAVVLVTRRHAKRPGTVANLGGRRGSAAFVSSSLDFFNRLGRFCDGRRGVRLCHWQPYLAVFRQRSVAGWLGSEAQTSGPITRVSRAASTTSAVIVRSSLICTTRAI